MVSTLAILGVASAALILAWSLLRSRHPDIPDGRGWEEIRQDVDVKVFRVLLDIEEERFLRNSLSNDQFLVFQRRRIRLALEVLTMVEDNTAMLMRLGQRARMKVDDRTLTQCADQLIATAIQLRFNLLLARSCLSIRWLFPSCKLSVPAFEERYQQLLISLAQIQRMSQSPA